MKCDLIKNHVETDSDRDRQRHTETDIEGLSGSFWAIWAYLGLSKLSAPIWPPTSSALLKDVSRVLLGFDAFPTTAIGKFQKLKPCQRLQRQTWRRLQRNVRPACRDYRHLDPYLWHPLRPLWRACEIVMYTIPLPCGTYVYSLKLYIIYYILYLISYI